MNNDFQVEKVSGKWLRLSSSPRGTWIVIWRTVVLLILIATMNGCVSYGGRPVKVNFTSDPTGAEVYMIPRMTWDNGGRTDMFKDPKKFEQYRVGGTQVTPFNARVSYIEQVLIVRFNERFAWTEVTPDEGDKLFLRIPSGGR